MMMAVKIQKEGRMLVMDYLFADSVFATGHTNEMVAVAMAVAVAILAMAVAECTVYTESRILVGVSAEENLQS